MNRSTLGDFLIAVLALRLPGTDRPFGTVQREPFRSLSNRGGRAGNGAPFVSCGEAVACLRGALPGAAGGSTTTSCARNGARLPAVVPELPPIARRRRWRLVRPLL